MFAISACTPFALISIYFLGLVDWDYASDVPLDMRVELSRVAKGNL